MKKSKLYMLEKISERRHPENKGRRTKYVEERDCFTYKEVKALYDLLPKGWR